MSIKIHIIIVMCICTLLHVCVYRVSDRQSNQSQISLPLFRSPWSDVSWHANDNTCTYNGTIRNHSFNISILLLVFLILNWLSFSSCHEQGKGLSSLFDFQRQCRDKPVSMIHTGYISILYIYIFMKGFKSS